MIANFAVTYRCNSRCTTCGIWASPNRRGDELTLSEITKFFGGERRFLSDVKAIQLTGGEPYLRDDLTEIAQAIWQGIPRAFIWVATNGLLPETIVKTTTKIIGTHHRGGLGVTVSIDGVGATHDEQRGVTGAFDKAVETIKLLSTLREENMGMILSLGMTITPHNQHQITEAVKQAEQLGVDISVRPMNVSHVYYRNTAAEGWDTELIRLGLRAVAEHQLKHKGLFRSAPVINFLRRIPGYIEGRRIHMPCTAGSSSLYLDPYGDVYPCLFLDKKMGDIRNARLSDTWRSAEAGKARRMIAGGLCPGCLVECETMRDIRRDQLGLASATFAGLGRLLGLNPSFL